MNRLFEEATGRGGQHAEASRGTSSNEEVEQQFERADWTPVADVFEREGEFVIAMDVPGIDRKSLDISLDRDRLVIRGERKLEEGHGKRTERPHGKFFRQFRLPNVVDQSAIGAECKNGELRISLPKRQEPRPNRVEIKVS